LLHSQCLKLGHTIVDEHQKLVNSLHRLLNCEIGGLDSYVSTTEYKTRVQCIHMYLLFCNSLVHVILPVFNRNRNLLAQIVFFYS